jgi:hypothetical protein
VTYHLSEVPSLFQHSLDLQLFSSDRLDALCRGAQAHGSLKVQFADPGRQRYGNDPVYTRPHYPILEDARRRPVQYRITGVDVFGDPEYRDSLQHIFDVATPGPAPERILPETVVRVFSPGAVVALHGDPDLKLISTISGETTWWVRPPNAMTVDEHERLLRGNFFLEWRDWPDEALVLPPGHGCFLPSRWPHWLTHPLEEPTVSFEIGYWTRKSLRDRKVYDVNSMLRRMKLDPQPPGGPRDDLKRRGFDAICTATRKGLQYRGL